MAVVYRHIRLDTLQVFYIGIGVKRSRAYDFCKNRRNPYWYNIYKKHGVSVEILFDNVSVEEAKKKEIELIKKHGRLNNNTGILVNMTDGGDGGFGLIFTEETKRKLSEKVSGENHHFFNKKLHPEHVKKVADANRGKKRSPEAIQNLINGAKNRKKYIRTELHNNNLKESIRKRGKIPISEETRKKISDSCKNRIIKEESKTKIRNTLKSLYEKGIIDNKKISKPLNQYKKNGEFVKTWDSAHQVQKVLGIFQGNISKCANGKINFAGGYIWKFLNN